MRELSSRQSFSLRAAIALYYFTVTVSVLLCTIPLLSHALTVSLRVPTDILT